MNPLLQVKQQGQQIWLDNLSRTLLRDGHLKRLIDEDGLAGVTTNPAIFHKAIADGRYYEEDLAALKRERLDAETRYERLVIPDVQQACDLLNDTYERSGGESGYVSLEVSPKLSHDANGTVEAGIRLARAVNRPNLLIKVPATTAGLTAIEALIARGISVNVTLMFSLKHVQEVANAYTAGIQKLLDSGGDARGVMSVASLFLSRIDTLVDRQLQDQGETQLQGHTAVALAKLAYQRYCEHFHGPRFASLKSRGARPQLMLWASTGTKNPAYSDLLYVEPLIGPETINTLPDKTLTALRDHGRVERTLDTDIAAAQERFKTLGHGSIDLDAIGEQLQAEGLQQFETAFAELLKLTE